MAYSVGVLRPPGGRLATGSHLREVCRGILWRDFDVGRAGGKRAVCVVEIRICIHKEREYDGMCFGRRGAK